MKGLSIKAVQSIERLIKLKFDSLSTKFLGLIPRTDKDKNIVFSVSKQNVISLFLQSLGSKTPNRNEEQILKVLLRIASNYIDALRDRTVARVVQDIDSYVKNQNMKDRGVSGKRIKDIVNENMGKAKSHFNLIVEAEANKAANTGTTLQIAKIAEEKGEKDPTVFFIGAMDNKTCKWCKALFFLEDLKTPRLWKLSELNNGYYQPGDKYPTTLGLHPFCRHRITYLAKGWGFNANGNVTYMSLDYDEFKAQRSKYGLPNVPKKPKKRIKK